MPQVDGLSHEPCDNDPIEFTVTLSSKLELRSTSLSLVVRIYNRYGVQIAAARSPEPFSVDPGKQQVWFALERLTLTPGHYDARLAVYEHEDEQQQPLADTYVRELLRSDHDAACAGVFERLGQGSV